MVQLFAQPYDISAAGFYFKTSEDYQRSAAKLRNGYGQLVEEFEIQFIDGNSVDAELFEALCINQGNFGRFLEVVAEWSEDDKERVIIAVREVGERFDLKSNRPEDINVELYRCDSMRDLAIQFVVDGLFGDIPKTIGNYLDYDAIARDLTFDYAQTEVNGQRIIYRAG